MTIQNACSNVSGHIPSSSADGQFQLNQADDVFYTHKPDGSTRRTLLPKRAGVADASYTVNWWDTYVGISTLTGPHPILLPPASTYPVGHALTIVDESGGCSPSAQITITPNGSDKVNGLVGLPLNTPNFGVILYSDGSSKWLATSLPPSAVSSAVLYVSQSLTAGQQDQARLNLNGATPTFPTISGALALTDLDRDQYVTGTVTLTMPGAAPGWRSGIISNDNPSSGTITLTVPTGHTLDGVTNGTTVLNPKQRARLRLGSAGVWRTDWVERSPTLVSLVVPSGTPVASADFALPGGYTAFEFLISNIRPGTNGSGFALRVSTDGTTFASGAADYGFNNFESAISTSTTSGTSTLMNVTGGISSTNGAASASFIITPGGNGLYASILGRSQFYDFTGAYANYTFGGVYGTSTSRVLALRLLFGGGTGVFNATVRGIQ